jgi:multidrug efflux pump
MAPVEDRSNMSLIAIAPEGVSFEKMKQNMMEVGKYIMILQKDYINTYSMVAISFIRHHAPTSFAVQSIYLKRSKERRLLYSNSIINTEWLRVISGISFCFPYLPPTIGTRYGGGMPVQFVLQAPVWIASLLYCLSF